MMNSTLPPGLVDQVVGLTPSQREELQIVIDELDEPNQQEERDQIRQAWQKELAHRVESILDETARLLTAEESIQRVQQELLKHDEAEHDLLLQRIVDAESGHIPALSREIAAVELEKRLAAIGLER